jgi:hypothetical protein
MVVAGITTTVIAGIHAVGIMAVSNIGTEAVTTVTEGMTVVATVIAAKR